MATMPECDACARAVDHPCTGRLNADCRGCTVRAISNAPPLARLAHYETIREPDERAAFAQAVTDEWRRRKAAK